MTTPEAVVRKAADLFGVEPGDIRGPRRWARHAIPRSVVAHVLHVALGMSYPAIGRFLGGRHHTTILAAVRRVQRTESRRRQAELVTMLVASETTEATK